MSRGPSRVKRVGHIESQHVCTFLQKGFAFLLRLWQPWMGRGTARRPARPASST